MNRLPFITPYNLYEVTEKAERFYEVLEFNLFKSMTERIIENKDNFEFEYWQLKSMEELRVINNESVRLLSQTTGQAEQEIRDAMLRAGYGSVESFDKDLQNLYGMQPRPLPNSLDQRISAYTNQTFRELDNYVNQTLITTNHGVGTTTQTYQRIVEDVTTRMIGGHIAIEEAVAETVIAWRRKGIPTSFVDKGGHTWGLEHYARTVLRSTTNRTYNELRMSRMDDYNMEFVRVSELPQARPACAQIQGGVASKNIVSSDPRYPSIYDFGYGQPDGLRGVNCRHMFFPFIPGVNENNNIGYNPEEAVRKHNVMKEQRRLETAVRRAKMDLELAEISGDEKVTDRMKQVVRRRQEKVKEYVKDNDLKRSYAREQIY